MNNRRLGVGLAVCGGCLYSIGGSDGSAPLATVERYEKDIFLPFFEVFAV